MCIATLAAGSTTVRMLTAQGVPATELQEWSAAAAQYGPFFFSLLFLCVLLWQVGKRMGKASADPDRRVWRRLLYCTFAIGVCLVAFSVYWWARTQVSTYLFHGRIQDLASYEQLVGSDFYFRNEWKESAGDAKGLRRDVHFLVLREKPFEKGQSFQLEFAKGPSSKGTKFQILYDPSDADPRFEIAWNESEQSSEIKKLTRGGAGGISALFSGVVLAQSTSTRAPAARPSSSRTKSDLALLLPRLQDERTDVGTKIDAIDRVLAADPGAIRELLGSRTEKESALSTFYALSVHSDRELASKARRVLDIGNAPAVLGGRLAAGAVQERSEAEVLLKQIPHDSAAAAVRDLGTRDPARARSLETGMTAQAAKVLKPTGSSQGDRYYVKASWNPQDTKTVRCLTELFNQELISSRTLDEEAKFMEGRSWRLVYWYSKEWTLQMSDRIQGCGAKAEFVQP